MASDERGAYEALSSTRGAHIQFSAGANRFEMHVRCILAGIGGVMLSHRFSLRQRRVASMVDRVDDNVLRITMKWRKS